MFKRFVNQIFPARAGQPAAPSSPFVPIRDAQGRVTGIMDQATADFLASTDPDPSQASLDALLARVTRARVLDDGMCDGQALGSTVLLECDDAPSLAALRASLAIVEDPRGYGHCMCYGDNAIELYAGQELLATIGLHHGRSIRWDAWKGDAVLRRGPALLEWMAERGAPGPLEAYRADLRRIEQSQQETQRWVEAMPACLRPHWPQMQGFKVDLEPLEQALELAYADPRERALALFTWFGSGYGRWSGFPMYEGVAERLLLATPTEALLAALAEAPAAPALLEGAARYFASPDFRKHKPLDAQRLPPELRQRLLRHSRLSPIADNVTRAQNAFF